MPRITINEVDNTLYSAANPQDNVVYIPGIATKGTYNTPILITSIRDFIDTFGDRPPEPDVNQATGEYVLTSWGYAYDLISMGFSVLFSRLVPGTTNNSEFVPSISTAVGAFVSSRQQGGSGSNLLINVKCKYAGTYGNRVKVVFNTKKVNVYLDSHVVETYTYPYEFNPSLPSDKVTEICDGIMSYSFSNIDITQFVAAWESADNKDAIMNALSSETGIIINLSGGTDTTVSQAREMLEDSSDTYNIFDVISDKYLYDVKFITSGGVTCSGYSNNTTLSNTTIYQRMLNLATKRQDCLAIFDIPFGSEAYKNGLNSLYKNLTDEKALSYATAYAPWAFKLDISTKNYVWCPPSFIFLFTLAESIRNGNFSWNIPAGVNRGSITNILGTEYSVGEDLLNTWQNEDLESSINPIMNLRSYGYTIFGQRTLYAISPSEKKYRSALREVGVRLVAIDIKKEIFRIAMGLTFEGNNVHTWSEFKGQLKPFLENIKANRGISSYQIVMDKTTTTMDNINSNTVVGIVRIVPVRAAENFDITFELNQDLIAIDDDDYSVVIGE